MPQSGNMRQACLERFGAEPETVIPQLIREHKTPYLVGVALGVYANAVRVWLTKHGYRSVQGMWVHDSDAARQTETNHA